MFVDGRATAWSVLADLVHLGAFIGLMAMVGRDFVIVAGAFLVFVGLLVLSDICQRASGVQLRPERGRVMVAAVIVGFAVVAAAIVLDLRESWFLGFLAACAVGATMAPIVRWFRSSRSDGRRAWGPGTEAFAILTMLDRAQAMTPTYLLARAGLEPMAGELWIERLRADHLLMGGQARRGPLGPAWVEITHTGRERLARMRLELERQAAAEVPVG